MSAELEQFVVVDRRQNHTYTGCATLRQERSVSLRCRVSAVKLADIGDNEHVARTHIDPRELSKCGREGGRAPVSSRK